MDDFQKVCDCLVRLARLIVGGKTADAVRFLQRMAYANRNSDALVWIELNNLTKPLSSSGENRSWDHIARTSDNPFEPRDIDTQFDLLAKDIPPIVLDTNPIFEAGIREALDMVIKERALQYTAR